jgi:hypothetical protein
MNREDRRMTDAVLERDRRIREKLRRSGEWPGWNVQPIPTGAIPSLGWAGLLEQVWENKIYAVLTRTLTTPDGVMVHLAIRNFDQTDIPWIDKMRIKDELCGKERFAVEVFPARSRLVDQVSMYHLWVYPEGYQPPFCLKT